MYNLCVHVSENSSDMGEVELKKRYTDMCNSSDESVCKKMKPQHASPIGFVDPLSPEERAAMEAGSSTEAMVVSGSLTTCKQFWKAGDYRGVVRCDTSSYSGGMDHARVHPKFLHSNATSHTWVLGAFAELLDNALDEANNGATYVMVDVLQKPNNNIEKMLLVEDNGGGMTPQKMRDCMSLGYSSKSKMANTIGQYGNGFKTSTMRLGADVIVFSRCLGGDGRSPTQSIGLLSYTFLTRTGKEDIMVPMLDYERRGEGWSKVIRSSSGDWYRNLETILEWSPYSSEEELLQQFSSLGNQGTRIIVYNLWEDVSGRLELDFDADQHDIQIRDPDRDKNNDMAKSFPNSRHFLTYEHSLRSYASILYLRIPPGFSMILRGEKIVHHNLIKDMMIYDVKMYKPTIIDHSPRDSNMAALVTLGFVKGAEHHIAIQGFNVYHKNRLIKPFWRVWNASGSDGRGVIGFLEADFVEPAHNKQGFEHTTALSRLEQKLRRMQKDYWSTHCHKVGYAPRKNKKFLAPTMGNPALNVAPINCSSLANILNVGVSNSAQLMEPPGFERSAARSQPEASYLEAIDTRRVAHERVNSAPLTAVKLEPDFGPVERSSNLDGLMMNHLIKRLQMEEDKNCKLEAELLKANQSIEMMKSQQHREKRIQDAEKDRLMAKVTEANRVIQGLVEKVKVLERKTI